MPVVGTKRCHSGPSVDGAAAPRGLQIVAEYPFHVLHWCGPPDFPYSALARFESATSDSHACSEGEKLSGGTELPVVKYRLDPLQEILLPPVVRPQRSDSLHSIRLADSSSSAPATPSAPTVAAFDPSSTAADPSILAPSAPLGPSPASSTHNALPIPTFHGRPRVRDLLAATIAHTPRAGSVAVATCGPAALTDEVGAACSDAIDPAKVLRGEHRINVMLHAERFGW